MRSTSSASMTTDFSFEKKSSWPMVATLVFESAVQAPMRCGCLRAYSLTESGRAAVGVALAQHRVDRGALELVVAGADILLGVRLRVVGVVRQVVALRLQLRDGGLQLRQRRRDVRQLDDVRLGRGGERAELGERVAEALLGVQVLGERGDDAAGERDVARLDLDTRSARERADDRERTSESPASAPRRCRCR